LNLELLNQVHFSRNPLGKALILIKASFALSLTGVVEETLKKQNYLAQI
jgi:hypothetical protein